MMMARSSGAFGSQPCWHNRRPCRGRRSALSARWPTACSAACLANTLTWTVLSSRGETASFGRHVFVAVRPAGYGAWNARWTAPDGSRQEDYVGSLDAAKAQCQAWADTIPEPAA